MDESGSADAHAPDVDGAADEPSSGFPIVGMGASAGGLAAFEAFFSAMPPDSENGMAFVLVQHLAPDHKSILSELVKRYTRMDVFEVENGMTVRPNCAYIIPPNRDMALLHGTLQLLEPAAPRGRRLPIDFFFRSLAQDQRERAICIVLSGTGSDGTLGVRAIKGEGGMVMAQSPESTEYTGMPRSAIATGLVDYVLPPAEMPAQLIAYTSHRPSRGARVSRAPQTTTPEKEHKKILVLLRARTGHDFSQYKQTTIERRIERRMSVQRIDHLEDYVRYLQEIPSEVDALFRDLLIGVTSFFRDPSAFQTLETHIIPSLFDDNRADATIRVWVPGCSTGEEAYSIAMLLWETRDALKRTMAVQVFATDMDRNAVDTARAGVYPESIAADIKPERLTRHFSQVDATHYRVRKSIRDLVVFSEQDLIKDPPFSRLDLLSCRNLLIYMGVELQQKLLPLFHYALNPRGVLFLGASESVGGFESLFRAIDRTAKLYRREQEEVGAGHPRFWNVRTWPRQGGADVGSFRKGAETKLQLRDITEQALLEDGPVATLVNERGEILYIHGHTGSYLEPAPGEPGSNILKMAREGLQHALTAALQKVVSTNERVVRPRLRVKTNGDVALVDLTVRPVAAGVPAGSSQRLFLVALAPVLPTEPHPVAVTPSATEGAGGDVARVRALEEELQAKGEYLHATLEEMQTTNEELTSSNEELQSMNEELQSTNEELETSKEELQSVNEELATVNGELQAKVTELSRINDDMNNLLAGTGIGTIFVDHLVRIQRFTPTVTQFVNLISTDVGRPLEHIMTNLVGYDQLAVDVHSVLDTLSPKEVEVQTRAGAWYLLRIRPYRTSENVIEGCVVTFTDVTTLKKAQAVLRESEALRRAAGALRDSLDAILVHDLEGRILAWNPGAARMYGWTEVEALSMNVQALVPEGQKTDALDLVQRLSRSEGLSPRRVQRLRKDGRIVDVMSTATALVNDQGVVYGLASTERGTG